MWGSRPSHPYYVCAVTHQRATSIPPGHPPTVNLSERLLREATTTFLRHAVYGPDRIAYWQDLLTTADQPDPAAPADRRTSEVEHTIADLERRLRNQVLALEDDAVAPAARRHISARITELERIIADHQASLARLTAQPPTTPPDPASVAALLDRLPVFGHALQDFSHRDLRRLFDSLDLRIVYDPTRRVGRVAITLAVEPGSTGESAVHGSSPCPRQDSNLRHPPPEGGALSAELRGPDEGSNGVRGVWYHPAASRLPSMNMQVRPPMLCCESR
jgi:hypothetical protein